MSDVIFQTYMEQLLNRCMEYKTFIVMGDLNINMSKESNFLKGVLEVHGVKNIVHKPTCFKSKTAPTTLDLVITNMPKRLQNVTCFDSGLSDFHHMVCYATKIHVPKRKTRKV